MQAAFRQIDGRQGASSTSQLLGCTTAPAKRSVKFRNAGFVVSDRVQPRVFDPMREVPRTTPHHRARSNYSPASSTSFATVLRLRAVPVAAAGMRSFEVPCPLG